MDEFAGRDEQPGTAPEPAPRPPRKWIAPLAFLLAVSIPVLILVLSNPDSTEIGFAGWNGSAPLWLLLVITFVAGAIVTRLLGWVWRGIRKRQKAQA